MIKIISSLEKRQNSTIQDFMNDLSALWDWEKVVYDDETPGNVTELWLTSKLYFYIESTKVYLKHTIGYSDFFLTSNVQIFVLTDNALLFQNTLSSSYSSLCISKTVNNEGVESYGAITSGSQDITIFTDGMTSNKIYRKTSTLSTSNVNTQLIPIFTPNSDEHFDSVKLAFLRKSTDSGKTVLNGEYYYCHDAFALPYKIK